ncbi:hypothetical protein NFI96_008079 [Prochilodus magdalenae]|nr:hypothetical protein NFI96_008079 [Prochilodus magdalenae]
MERDIHCTVPPSMNPILQCHPEEPEVTTTLITQVRGSTTTTTVLESRGSDASAPSIRASKRSMTDDLYTTFSSPMAWVLVLALVITWSAVAIIVFDLLDTKSLEGPQPSRVRKAFKEAGSLRGKPCYKLNAVNFAVLCSGRLCHFIR